VESQPYDVAIIGGGIVGTATAMALGSHPGLSLVLLEAEESLAAHQSGHNSGVIHSGLYYKPGSLKARNCTLGRQEMYRFCQEHGIPHERCGKLVIATQENELPALQELERRGLANGLEGFRRLGPEEIREVEPHAVGIAGLWVPETGIVDYAEVTRAFADVVQRNGGRILTGARVLAFHAAHGEFVLVTAREKVRCKHLINCAGLQSDRVARLCGVEPGLQIIPFRGEYYFLLPERRSLVRNLIYPVPDPRFPFLGVHFTRTIHGGVEAGPNAVLALKREGYGRFSASPRDIAQWARYGGYWRMVGKYWKTGVGELYRSLSKRAFVKALQRLIPELRHEDLRRGGAGVRAQAVDPTGALVDDFRIIHAERMIHVLNAPSPAATASISIGKTVAAMAAESFDFPRTIHTEDRVIPVRGEPASWS
jgi:(S)-2-hydroxyglutarate dehydrogenase